MVDSVAVLPALSFVEQINDLANFLSRSLPDAEKSQLLSTIHQVIEAQTQTSKAVAEDADEPKQTTKEPSDEEKDNAVNELVSIIVEGHPGLEGADKEIESQYLVLTTLILATGKAEQTLEGVMNAVVRSASGSKKAEVACRILMNIYNLLPTSSRIRPVTLTLLLRLLSSSTTLDISSLPLNSAWLASALSEWSLSTNEKISWLSETAKTFESTGAKKSDQEKALELRLIALNLAVAEGDQTTSVRLSQEALKAIVAIPSKFNLDDVLNVQNTRVGLTGGYKQLVEMFETGQVEESLSWIQENRSFFASESLNEEQVVRKIRLLALMTLCATSTVKEIPYDDISKTLKLDADQIEIFVIDAIHSGLMKGSLSQPTKTLRVQSVQTRAFGSTEWQLLDKRLGEWKHTLNDVQKVIQDAIVANEQAGKDLGRGYKKGFRKPNGAHDDGKDRNDEPRQAAAGTA